MRPAATLLVGAGAALAWQVAPAAAAIGPVRRAVLPKALSGATTGRHVALTFDDGPDPAGTPRFLDVLAEHGVHATFFVLGRMVERAPEVAARIVAEGHEIALHGWDHVPAVLRTRRRMVGDLHRARALVADVTGAAITWYRPPYGVLSGSALAACSDLGLRPVLWTAWGRDWTRRATPGTVVRTVRRLPAGGGTVLLHDSDTVATPSSWQRTLGALPLLLDGWARENRPVGTLTEHMHEDDAVLGGTR